MVTIRIEVREGAARFGVSVRAESIERALRLVEERYPARKIRVKFPINPEEFFGSELSARAPEDAQPDVSAA